MSNIVNKEIEEMQRLINFKNSDNVSKVSNKPVLEYHMAAADGNTYGIIRECNKFYIKVAPHKDTEVLAEDYDYIGGINNKSSYEYGTYALASKQFDLKMMSLNEAYLENKKEINENIVSQTTSEWQVEETKEMRSEIDRFKQLSENVDKILGDGGNKGFTVNHTLPEAPAQNPNKEKVNKPYTDTAVAKGDKDFNKQETNYKKAGKPYSEDGELSDSEMQSDKNVKGKKGEVYTEKAKYVPDNAIANQHPSGAKSVKMNECKKNKTFKLTEAQVLAWHQSESGKDYMDKSHTTKIGDGAPYTEKVKVNEGYYDEPTNPDDVLKKTESLKSNMISLNNGDFVYFYYDPNKNMFIAGGATNAGIIPDYEMEYDFDYTYDQNLQSFVDMIDEKTYDDGMVESKRLCNKEVNEEEIDVNDVAGMPDEEDYDDIPFPEVENDDDEYYIDGDDEDYNDVYEESKASRKTVSENIVLTDFGKHPSYQKSPMSLSFDRNTDDEKFGNDWNDASAKGNEPYGKKIGSSYPYDEKIVNIIADNVLNNINKKKKISSKSVNERKVIKIPNDDGNIENNQIENNNFDTNLNSEPLISGVGNDINPQDNQNDGQEFDTDFDAGVDADENEDPKKYIQQLTGKLSQTLRKYNSELPSPDADLNKYVVGMINKQAVKGLSEKDITEIFKEIKSDEELGEEEPDTEDDKNNNDMPNDMDLNDPNDNFQNESVDRQRINEIFQEIINGNQDDEATTKIKNNGEYKKMPFTAPKFKK